ncbi:hypothetical protein [Candidatus Nitrosocosmicus franklandus]|nr:hypothetical protein [Candidatus Nitrosocosmicus franklandus]
MGSAIAQLSGDNTSVIQITSTSTYTDEFGSFHIIGEVNNTSTQPQTNIIITAILSNLATNSIVGNYSALSSIETLRSGELSPFDIVIQNPQQILGTFDFMEFSVTSESALAEKPANLVLNGSSSYVDNVGNPHITGNIINKGQAPEQFINLVATFYDNSSLGVVGTQSFGLDIGNLPSNQMVPFDITITDNKTKSQGAFYSLNVDSVQSSMSPPLNPKFVFGSGGFTTEQFFTGESVAPYAPLLPLTSNGQGSNDNNDDDDDDNNNGNSGSRNNDNNGDDLDCEDIDERNFPVGDNDPNNFDADGDGIGCEAEDLNNNGDDLDCEDIDERNFPVGDNDPNNFDADGDGIGCENEGGSNNQTNNDEVEEPKTDNGTTQADVNGIDGTGIVGTAGESSTNNSEQTDPDGSGASNEQSPEIANGNGNDNNGEENSNENQSKENNDGNDNDGEGQDDNSENDENN